MDHMEIWGSLFLPGCVRICSKSLPLWSELLPTDSPPNAHLAVLVWNSLVPHDPSSCVIVYATSSGGLDIKYKGKAETACLYHQRHGMHILCLLPFLNQGKECDYQKLRGKESCVNSASHGHFRWALTCNTAKTFQVSLRNGPMRMHSR